VITLSEIYKYSNVFLSIVIPAKNEAENLHKLVHEILANLCATDDFEIICVDDGSKDNTKDSILELSRLFPDKVHLIQHDTCIGQSTAIFTGVCNARGKLIVTLDADGQNNPIDIPKLLIRAEKRLLDPSQNKDFCIAGYRKARKDTAWKRFQSCLANKVRGRLLNDSTPDTGCGLKIFPKITFMKLPYFDHMHRYLPALIKPVGGHIEIAEVSHHDRKHGISNYGMWGRLFADLIDMVGVMWLQNQTKLPIISSNTLVVKKDTNG
jgi:dolichol-phosphate mannosyltransferase